MKILLVDDDAFLREMYATKFGESGHDVHVAETGEAALEEMQKNPYDVVMLDMIMPGMSGIELLEKMHQSTLSKVPKCIVLSNQGEQSEIDAAMKMGAEGYIIKAELIPSEVVEKVTKMMS